MSLAIDGRTRVTAMAEGGDSRDAMQQIADLFARRFDEDDRGVPEPHVARTTGTTSAERGRWRKCHAS